MTNVSGVNGANNDGYEYNKDNKQSTEVKSSIFNDLWSLDDYDGDGKFTMKDIHSNNTMFTKRVGLYLEKLCSGKDFNSIKKQVVVYLKIFEEDYGEQTPAKSLVDNNPNEFALMKFFNGAFANPEDLEKMTSALYKKSTNSDGTRFYSDNIGKILYSFNDKGERAQYLYNNDTNELEQLNIVNINRIKAAGEYVKNDKGIFKRVMSKNEGYGDAAPAYNLSENGSLIEIDMQEYLRKYDELSFIYNSDNR